MKSTKWCVKGIQNNNSTQLSYEDRKKMKIKLLTMKSTKYVTRKMVY